MRHCRAFTFVEILAALVFLGILMPAVVSALTLANRTAVIAERSSIALQLGENQLNELMFADAWISAATRGTFGEQHPGYRWEVTRRDWEAGGMVELTMHTFFPVQGEEREVQLTTLVGDTAEKTL